MRRARRLALGVAGAALGGYLAVACASGLPLPDRRVPDAPAAEVVGTLLLVGDAGAPDPRAEPVLRALTAEIARDPARTTVVFLGDNVYPRGVPAPGDPDRAAAERRLTAQLDASAAAARVVVVPGNHDWARHRPDGWDAVRREEALVVARGGPFRFAPSGGCPGPEVIEAGPVRLVVLDTQWWLHEGPRPEGPSSPCRERSEADVTASLRRELAAPGPAAIVIAHHPLRSGGEHGGHYGPRDHLFPLTNLAPWAWLPLPAVGSIYPGFRHRFTQQDLASPRNRKMRAALGEALAARPPLLYASGHEHNLQVLRGAACPLLVSGAGIYGEASRVTALPETVFARAAGGFARLDVTRDGRARLAIRIAGRDGEAVEAFSAWLGDL